MKEGIRGKEKEGGREKEKETGRKRKLSSATLHSCCDCKIIYLKCYRCYINVK